MEQFTPKKRMLNAYRGIPSDRAPVAPEFWNYFPAKVLGIPMIEFEREVPFWQSLMAVFTQYRCEGFGIVFPERRNPEIESRVTMDGYRETTSYRYRGQTFTLEKMYDKDEPCWVTHHLAEDPDDIPAVLEMLLDEQYTYDCAAAANAHTSVGESYLLELWSGVPFFDWVAEAAGFENAVLFFADTPEQTLCGYRERYMQRQRELIQTVVRETAFESFMIGCSYSCNSLIGKHMWRKWDKPYLQAMTEEIHRHGKLLHIHFHGKSIETAADFAEIGMDCVCPFERSPGGDVSTQGELAFVRRALDNRVTFNGNVHTIDTLIRGTPEQTRREVREIKSAFAGSNRFIIGTGDQVGRETREENILAMIDEAKR